VNKERIKETHYYIEWTGPADVRQQLVAALNEPKKT